VWEPGGWFKRSKDYTLSSALDASTTDGLRAAVQDIQATTGGYLKALGLTTDGVSKFTEQLHVELQGLDAAGQNKAITAALDKFKNDLIESAASVLDSFSRESENASATLSRLVGNLSSVNAALDLLSETALAASLKNADAAQQLVDTLGGADKLQALASKFFDNYYSAAERSATQTRLLTAQLGNLGLTLPTTRSAYRQLVEAQDLTTAAGRNTYAALLTMADAFAGISTAADEAVLNVGGLTAEIKRLRGGGDGNLQGQSMAALRAQFAIQSAQATAGSQAAVDALPNITKAIEAAGAATARSSVDLASLRAELANSLSNTLANLGGAAATSSIAGGTITATSPLASQGATSSVQTTQDALLREMQALRASIDALRADNLVQTGQIATNTGKTARLLDSVALNGSTLRVKVIT
jgi:hypothetical protein